MFVQYIFSDKTIVFTSTCTFPSRHLKCKKITGFLSAKSLLILQIKVRHKVLNRSERVKYMYTMYLHTIRGFNHDDQDPACRMPSSDQSFRPSDFIC